MEAHSETEAFRSGRHSLRLGVARLGSALIVDDEPAVRRTLARALRARGWRCDEAACAREALERLENTEASVVIADLKLRGESGIELLEELRTTHPQVQRVLMTGAPDGSLVREAINRGGVNFFLGKPWRDEDLAQLEETTAVDVSNRFRDPGTPTRIPEIIGQSPAIRELVDLVGNVADTESTVLVTGETGTGKELVGRAIHELSRRRERNLCAVNSAAFPETLLESELFGHRRGAFTGASSNSKGLFVQADGSTVFLDEVAEMPLPMQAKLLRFLQTGEVRPVGGDSTQIVDVRLVAATNKDLEEEVRQGRFREDLYYRLAVIPLRVPPLRERGEDILLLAQHFLERMCAKSGRALLGFEPEVSHQLLAYAWPGNVRELENAIERGVALARSERLRLEDLPRKIQEGPVTAHSSRSEIQSLPGLERQHILKTLEQVGWNRKRAAELLQISTTTLWRRLKEFGVDAPRSSNVPPEDSLLSR